MTAIEHEIKQIIEDVICCKYIGKLKVVKEVVDDSEFWMLLLYLDMEQTPLILAYEGTEDQFKDFIRSEIKLRKLQGVRFWKAIQTYPQQELNCCDE